MGLLIKLSIKINSNICGYCSKTMRFLNVAEKNDAAKNIAAILSRGGSNRREGLSKYNKIYEFNATVFGQQSQMIMTSVSGHLLNYEFTSTFRSWMSCNPVQLFEAPVVKTCPQDYQNIKKTLEREIRSCNGLIIWTDCDREGENIGFEIIKVCSDIKPNLTIYRAKFSEITGPSIFRSLNTLGQPNKNISDAVDVRQELDLRTGAAFTRLQTLRLQRVFPDKLSQKLISYGSCQFPTLGFVVDRYQAIENFLPETFWRIKMAHRIKELIMDFSWKRDRLFDKNACEAILDICKESNRCTVESVENKPKSRWRPLPLDTVEMEKTISKKLKITAKETMKIAENLYTKGFISYPRTETNIYPKELNLTNLVQEQRQDNRWGPFAQRILDEGGPTPRAGKKSDQAHPPIHPTKYATGLTGRDQQVYEYIVRHFLASVHKDAKGFETTINVDLADEKFFVKGLVVLEKNYLEVYIYDKWSDKEIHEYQEGDVFTPTTLELAESRTSPPKLLTEAELIALMDKHGIGTDATHAEHIDKIKSREYVGMHENMFFVPGTLGMGLVEGYNNIGLEVSLAKPNLRADFEKDLKLICDGVKDADTVRREQIQTYKAVFETVMARMQEIDNSLANRLEEMPQIVQQDMANAAAAPRPVMKCPKCGGDMFVRNQLTGNGKFVGCVNYPNCKNSVWFPNSVENVEVLEESCNLCGPDVKKVKIKCRYNIFVGDPNPNVYCIGGCDITVLETLDINPDRVSRRAAGNRPPNDCNVENEPNRHLFQNNLNMSVVNNAPVQPVEQVRRPASQNNNIAHNNIDRNTNRNIGSDNSSSNRPNNNNRWASFDPLPGPSGVNRTVNFNATVVRDTDIVCSCNESATLLSVKKDGPNKGRQFYKCQGSACNFFLWAPDGNTESEENQNSQTNRGNAASVQCTCNQPAVLRTVRKEGPNKGRQFYGCENISGGCRFFQWADDTDNRGGGSNGNDDDDNDGGGGGGRWGDRTGNNGNGNYQWNMSSSQNKSSTWKKNPTKTKNTRAGPYKPRKCGHCGEPGHTRAKCPNK